MKLAGKCPPEPGELEAVEERGFDCVELMLEKQHLDCFEETLNTAHDSEIDIVSIHTPHVSLNELEYFRKADELAEKLDAFLVVHSQFMHHVHMNRIEDAVNFGSSYGYENNPGASTHHLRNLILEQGYKLALDTAHLFVAEENYIEELELLLESGEVPLIHICDSVKTQDGLGFGEGEMEMEEVCKTIDRSSFDGVLVFEVMPEHQEVAREKWDRYTGA